MNDDDIIGIVLKFEGGFVNNAADHGGPTNFGITAADLGRWRKLGRSATAGEVQAMQVDEARAIYQTWYITQPGFDAVANGILRLILVDSGVLHGIGRAIRWLQQGLHVAVDGAIGDKTHQALAALPDAQQGELAREVLGLRFQSYGPIVTKDTSQLVFLSGWLSRSSALLTYL